jgi:GABA(A) receptor-associated protein
MQFKQNHSFEDRAEQSRKILKKFPDRIPVVVERAPSGPFIGELEKTKFLLPYDATVIGFMSTLRKQVVANSSDGFYMFCGNKNVLVSGSNTFQHLYANYKDDDGFLYMMYAGENVFG